MSLSAKQVRFKKSTDNDVKKLSTQKDEAETEQRKTIDLSSLLKENPREIEVLPLKPRKKTAKKKKTQVQKLKHEKKKLMNELKKVEKGIKEDSERKGSAEYTPYENRKRLARSTSELHSKVKQLDQKLSVKQKLKQEKIKKSYKTKIKTKTIKAGQQHQRLITMTSKLHDLKLDEGDIRDEIRKEKVISSLATTAYGCPNNAYDMTHVDDLAETKWMSVSDHQSQTIASDVDSHIKDSTDAPNNDCETQSRVSVSSLEMARLNSSMSLTSGLSLEEKELKAQRLAKKYEFTRDLRNIIHQHMISRSYSFSYTNIIPPYKHKKIKPMKTRQSYNRNVYEEKLNVLEFAKQQRKLPAI